MLNNRLKNWMFFLFSLCFLQKVSSYESSNQNINKKEPLVEMQFNQFKGNSNFCQYSQLNLTGIKIKSYAAFFSQNSLQNKVRLSDFQKFEYKFNEQQNLKVYSLGLMKNTTKSKKLSSFYTPSWVDKISEDHKLELTNSLSGKRGLEIGEGISITVQPVQILK